MLNVFLFPAVQASAQAMIAELKSQLSASKEEVTSLQKELSSSQVASSSL